MAIAELANAAGTAHRHCPLIKLMETVVLQLSSQMLDWTGER